MNFIDILILLVFAGSLIFGFRKGLIRQLGSVAGIVVGLIAARALGGAVASAYGSMMPDAWAASPAGEYATGVMGRVTVIIVVYTAVVILARSLRMVAHTLLLGPIDRALGAVMAMLQWFVGLSLALNAWAAMTGAADNPDSWLHRSALGGGRACEAVMGIGPALTGGIDMPLSDSHNQSTETDENGSR